MVKKLAQLESNQQYGRFKGGCQTVRRCASVEWLTEADSNHQPQRSERRVLPVELSVSGMVEEGGIEPLAREGERLQRPGRASEPLNLRSVKMADSSGIEPQSRKRTPRFSRPRRATSTHYCPNGGRQRSRPSSPLKLRRLSKSWPGLPGYSVHVADDQSPALYTRLGIIEFPTRAEHSLGRSSKNGDRVFDRAVTVKLTY